jgi:hypothetical protein
MAKFLEIFTPRYCSGLKIVYLIYICITEFTGNLDIIVCTCTNESSDAHGTSLLYKYCRRLMCFCWEKYWWTSCSSWVLSRDWLSRSTASGLALHSKRSLQASKIWITQIILDLLHMYLWYCTDTTDLPTHFLTCRIITECDTESENETLVFWMCITILLSETLCNSNGRQLLRNVILSRLLHVSHVIYVHWIIDWTRRLHSTTVTAIVYNVASYGLSAVWFQTRDLPNWRHYCWNDQILLRFPEVCMRLNSAQQFSFAGFATIVCMIQ